MTKVATITPTPKRFYKVEEGNLDCWLVLSCIKMKNGKTREKLICFGKNKAEIVEAEKRYAADDGVPFVGEAV